MRHPRAPLSAPCGSRRASGALPLVALVEFGVYALAIVWMLATS